MRMLFTICGRAGSKGVKNKNLKNFLGVPLVYYTLAAVCEYKKYLADDDIVDVVLNTDSDRLAEIVCGQRELSVFVIHREGELAGDSIPKVAVIKNCLQKSEEHFGYTYDVVVDLDITSPLRTAQDVKNAVDRKLFLKETDVVYSVAPSRRNPYFNMVREEDGFSSIVIPSDFTARQQAPMIYDMNASIYVYSPIALKNKPSIGFFHSNCSFIVMKDTGILDIDSEEDFKLMQVIAEYILNNDEEFRIIAVRAKNLR